MVSTLALSRPLSPAPQAASAAARLQDLLARVERAPADGAAWDELVCALLASGRPQAALAACGDGLRRLPGDARLMSRLARCRLECGEPGPAKAAVEAALAAVPLDLVGLTQLGLTASACEQHALAHQAFAAAARLAPDDPRTLFNLASSHRNLGAFEAAEALYDAVLARDPNDWEALKNRSDLKVQSAGTNHVAELRAALARCGEDLHARALLHSALGKELEDLGDDDNAFAHFHAAAAARRGGFSYDVEQDLRRMDEIAATFAGPAAEPGCETEAPIFVVGLPRTGSTLLARILGSLEGVRSAGELQSFGIQVFRLAREHIVRAPGAHGLSVIAASARVDPRRLGEAYMRSVGGLTGDAPRFIDKLPTNFLYVGLIARALPKAKIIHVRRHPLDACFAMYKTQFKQAYPFSYSLDELARYYAGYAGLMEHWRGLMGERLLEIAYEDLVRSPEPVIRGLCGPLGLAYDPACLDLAGNTAPVSTASAAQVRRPIYDSSVGRWRRHASALAPLTDRLRESGVSL